MRNPKKILFIVFLFISLFADARTYYVSTTGNDANPGTITAPFASWERLSSVLVAGDIAYIRGGTYHSGKAENTDAQVRWQNLNGNATDSIKIFAYPGEYPIMDLSDVLHTAPAVYGLYLQNLNYVWIKGLRITGLAQNPTGNVLWGLILVNSNNCRIEACEVDNIGGQGYFSYNSSDILYKNCDAHHCDDRYSSYAWNGSNGFSATSAGNTSTRNTYDGCRAWWISDDGWDFYGTDGYFTVTNCWSFWNGFIPGTFIPAGDGVGYKLGPTASDMSAIKLRIMTNNISAENRSLGFDQNGGNCRSVLLNNTAYGNGEEGFMWGYFPSIAQTAQNNISFNNRSPYNGAEITGDHNSWNGGVSINTLDFLSVSSAGLVASRKPDGSLPDIPFLHLDPTSDVIDKGIDVGLPYNDAAPDLGAFEYSTGNLNPIANAGVDQNITLPISILTLNGSASDPDGTVVSYQWTKLAGPVAAIIVTPNLSTSLVTTLTQGVFQFELKVTDNQGAVGRDTIIVTVNAAPNQAPTANAGADKTITLPINNVTVNGSGNDPDGTVAAYLWRKIAGPTSFTIVAASQASTDINNLTQGVYQFELRVTDNQGAIGRDTMIVTVNAAPNQAPTANAGINRTITLPINSLTLNGSGSDPDGTIAAYLWSKISGPTSFTIVSPSQAATLINNLTQGVYEFELRVTDNQGAIGRDTVSVTVNPTAANQAPTANAGSNQNITLPTNNVTVTGSGNDPDGTIAAYQWTKVSGPTSFTIVNATQASTVINNLAQGVYEFELSVTDNIGAIGKDTLLVTVNAAPANQAPTANAGLNQNITLPTNSVTVNGSGSDADGTIAAYQWTKVSGPTSFTIVSATQASTVINNLAQGVYEFELRVTDNQGAVGRDTVLITVNAAPANQAPTANAGLNQNITLPTNSVTVNGSGNDPDGTITAYQWTKVSGPTSFTIVSTTQASTIISNLVQGVYQFELRVTDNQGAIGRDTVLITVNAAPANQAPTANAGLNQNITLPNNIITVNGSGIDPDGTIVAYQWTKIAGPNSYTISSPTLASTIISNLVQAVYQFELRVTDNQGAFGRDTVLITVNAAPANQPPTANAGLNQNITLPTNSVTVNGSGSDPDGTIAAYQWTKIAGPTSFTIVNTTQASTAINNLTQGDYQFELRVTDNQGAFGRDTILITVNAAPANQAPTANAGLNQNITLPTNIITVNGSGSDPDGTIAAYQWTKIAGPASYTISSPTVASSVISSLVQGVYQFELRVTDNQGAFGRDTIIVVVNAQPNVAPSANAGLNQNITLPSNSVTLIGNGTDPDGTIIAYQWTKINGPSQLTIVSATQATTNVNNLVQGVYQFELRVTDNLGAFAKDTVIVTVNAAALVNQAPVISAGNNITIILPENAATLKGNASDIDGTITGYTWTKIAGPSLFSIVNSNAAETVVKDLVEGSYLFQVKATDNAGAIALDTVEVLVQKPLSFAVSGYPNPVSNILNLKIEDKTAGGSASILIYDMAGKVVYQESFVRNQTSLVKQINVAGFINGNYIIKVRTDNSGATLKIVKQ